MILSLLKPVISTWLMKTIAKLEVIKESEQIKYKELTRAKKVLE